MCFVFALVLCCTTRRDKLSVLHSLLHYGIIKQNNNNNPGQWIMGFKIETFTVQDVVVGSQGSLALS